MDSPDHVIDDFREKNVSLKVVRRVFEGEADAPEEQLVVIEGDRVSLEFLGRLLIAQARFENHCHISLSPFSAGKAYFAPGSNIGIYIHRLPCDHEAIDESS